MKGSYQSYWDTQVLLSVHIVTEELNARQQEFGTLESLESDLCWEKVKNF